MIYDGRMIAILDSPEDLAVAAAGIFTVLACRSIRKSRVFRVALSGGRTPERFYRCLSDPSPFRDRIPWGYIHFYWSDERHVPPDHPDSNFKLACDTLISRVPVPMEHIHRIRSELTDATEIAHAYQGELRRSFDVADGQLPQFDLILLGLGEDGHTASLFPSVSLDVYGDAWVAAPWVPDLDAWRITLTPQVINQAQYVLFLVSGVKKAPVVRELFAGEGKSGSIPAGWIQPVDGQVIWLLDRCAARQISDHSELTDHQN